MTAERYVNAVVKRVKCSNEKRREIRQQMLSDISAALEQGESLDEVINRMGTAKDMANEFNENISETEQKKYVKKKRMQIIVIAVAAVVVMAVLVVLAYLVLFPKTADIGSAGIFEETVVEEKVVEVVEWLNDDNYEALQADATEEMQPVLAEEQMQDVKKQLSDDWGECQSFGTVYMSEVSQMGKDYAMGEITVTYENINVTFRLSFDQDMKLAGLYMR